MTSESPGIVHLIRLTYRHSRAFLSQQPETRLPVIGVGNIERKISFDLQIILRLYICALEK